MRSPRVFPRRRGVSLVEMMATMTILTVVLGLTVALLEMLLKLNSSGRDHMAVETSIARLAHAFRRDVRDADDVSRCEKGGTSRSLDLQIDDRSSVVEYQAFKTEIRRVEWSGLDIVKQDRFEIPASSEAHFERPADDATGAVNLVIARRSRKGDLGTVRAMRIGAILGANLRFDRVQESRE